MGTLAFLYSRDDGPLPAPSTYSINAITFHESATGPTSFNGNGTIYTLDIPEPSTLGLLLSGVVAMLFLFRKRSMNTSPARLSTPCCSGIATRSRTST